MEYNSREEFTKEELSIIKEYSNKKTFKQLSAKLNIEKNLLRRRIRYHKLTFVSVITDRKNPERVCSLKAPMTREWSTDDRGQPVQLLTDLYMKRHTTYAH